MAIALRRMFLTCLFSGLLQACGGGSDGGNTPAPVPMPSAPIPPATPVPTPVPPPTRTAITLQSTAGDPIGRGATYQYTRDNTAILTYVIGNVLQVEGKGDEFWSVNFRFGRDPSRVTAGQYLNVEAFNASQDPSKDGMSVKINGRTCAKSTGSVYVDRIEYGGNGAISLSMRFEIACEGSTGVLRGEIQATDSDRPVSLSAKPVPGDLWQPPASVANNSVGNYMYIESADGDYVGQGKTYLLDRRSANMEFRHNEKITLSFVITGDDVWGAEFSGLGASQLTPGYYPDAGKARVVGQIVAAGYMHNPVTGGFSVTGAGRGCSTSKGWFAVDRMVYNSNGRLDEFDVRFEQHCEGRAAPLRGAIHYRAPVFPPQIPPKSLPGSWRAPVDVLSQNGNFFYTESDPAEATSLGRVELQTSSNAAITASFDGSTVHAESDGNRLWRLKFRLPSRFAQAVPGVYDNVTVAPGDVATFGALYVSAGSRGCDAAQGWVVIDNAEYSGDQLIALEMRFEQRCGSGSAGGAPLHGHLRWRAEVPEAFPGPAAIPDLFWRPALALPAGTHVYLASDESDYVGAGILALFTPADADIALVEQDGKLEIAVKGATQWQGTFQMPKLGGRIMPGYYPDISKVFRPARGGFEWRFLSRPCNWTSSGVVVDSAVYVGDKLSELKLRFEQHCDYEPGALRGEVHWFASGTP